MHLSTHTLLNSKEAKCLSVGVLGRCTTSLIGNRAHAALSRYCTTNSLSAPWHDEHPASGHGRSTWPINNRVFHCIYFLGCNLASLLLANRTRTRLLTDKDCKSAVGTAMLCCVVPSLHPSCFTCKLTSHAALFCTYTLLVKSAACSAAALHANGLQKAGR